MSAIVFASPKGAGGVTLPPEALAEWDRFELIWEGWDGSKWDLRDLAGGIFVTNEGITGLHDPTWELETSVSPGAAGRRRRGARSQERPFRLPVYMWSDDGSAAWLDLYRRFMHSFHPLKPGTLTVRTINSVRTIELYYDGAGEFAYTRDPIYSGYSRYPLNLTAEDPYFKGATIERSWENLTPQPFFGADGNLWVSSGAALETATIEHDGDVASWVTWLVRATPESSVQATITVDGGALGTPTIPADGVLVIVTDPQIGSAELNGVEVDGDVNPWDPRPVPEGEEIPLSLQLVGSGSVSLQLVPRYWRAF